MNFEQNFSPLDPSSEEYQSIGDEYLQIAPSVGGETEKRKQENPITLKDLGLQKPVSQKKEAGLSGLEAIKLEDKAILSARQSQIELEDTYNNVVKSGTSYLNGVVEKLKQEKPEYQAVLSEFLREQASLNTPEQLKQRVDKSWDFLSSVSDINDNYATRDAWINSQYAGAYYSKSKAVKDEYESSDLKDKLTQRQYAGLRSLIYGKQSDFNDFVDVIKSQDAKQAEKDLVLAKLDKIGSNLDIAAGSAIGKDGGKLGIELFNEGKSGAKDAEDKLIQVEYDNPFTLQSFKDIASRAIERGMYSGEVADILTVTSEQSGIPYERLAELNRFQQEARQSKAYEEFQKDKSFENFMKNPIGIMAEVTLESLVAMYRHGASRMSAGTAEGAVAGSIVPGIGTTIGASTGMIAGSGVTSLNLEYSSKILETLSENGVDITNAESLRNAFGNQQLMDKARESGLKKGIPVALFDMLSAGIAGKFVSKGAKAIMTTAAPTIGKKIFGGVAELGAQAALGGIGEAAGQITEKGGIYDVNGVVMEMLGETFGSAGEIVTGRAFEIAKRNEPLKTRDLVSIISTNDKGFINNNIDAHLAAGVLNEEQAASLKNQISYTEGMMNKLPSGMSIDGSANIIDLIGQRNAIISNAETLDDAFKKKANAEAKQIDEQILNIFNSEQNAIKENTGQKQVSPKQGGISQYEGVEGQQAQATTEANDSNRPIGSQAQFQVGKQDVGVYKKETSAITNKMNEIGGAAVEFTPDNAVNATSKSNVSTLSRREGIVKQPNTVSITDFNGIPMMLTISDELTTGSIVNPATGNVISDLNGGVGFNYSEGNTDLAWAYTDKETATDTLNYAKDIYKKNKQLFDKLWAEGRLPQNHIPVAVVKMGTEAINSNEAVFRVFLDNLQSLPKQNLKLAYSELVKDIDANYKRLSELSKRKTLSPSERNALNGFAQIRNEYLKKNKSILDVVSNIAELNINTRPLITDRISAGEVGLLPSENRLVASKPVTKALMKGLPKSEIKKIHLGYIAEPLRDSAIKDVPARHIISFVGIDISKNEPVQTGNHKNYPYALSGQGLGVVENTAHISSVMPTAYGNIVSKITDAVAKEGSITPGEAVSRALPSGLANFIFRNKTLATNDNLSKLIGFLNLSFPDVTFFTDKQSFEDVLSSEGVKEYLKDGDVIYGVTKDGNIYLNPEKATYNTAIHEIGHIWVDFIENTKPELFAQGLKLVEGTAEFEAAKARLGDTVFARKEALAMLIGNKGETIADAAMKSQFKEWLVGVWKYLQEVFPSLRKLTPQQIENLSLQDFLGGALKDILSGKPISTQKSEYTAAESQFQVGEKPSWFDNTPGAQKITVTADFIKENPDLVDSVKQYLFSMNKNKKDFKGDVKLLKDAIDSLINEGNFEINSRVARNIVVSMYNATPKSKSNIAKTISMIQAAERMNALFDDKANTVTKEEVKKSIEMSNEYTDDEKSILYGIVDDIIPEDLFRFIDESSEGALKNENYYAFATNLLKSKKPSSFVHEVGHWGFYNILTPEERIEFFKYAAERFAKDENKLEDEQAFGRPFKVTREIDGKLSEGTAMTNATEDFMEYFAEQFRQYYIENKITDAQFNTLFKKISLVLDKILDLFRKASYNKELVKYFDKIIDARPKEQSTTQEPQQETGIVKVTEAQPTEEERGIIKTGGEITPAEPVQEEAGLPEKKQYEWEKGNEGRPAEGETMIPTSTGRYVAVETMSGQKMDMDRKMSEIEKAKPSFYKEMMSWIRSAMIDNQAKVLTALEKIGKQGQLVKAYLLTRNSASATATILADKAINEIYGDISKKKVFNINGAKFTEYQLFNQMIGYQRVISIQKQMNEAYKVMMNSEVGSPEYNISKQRLLDNNMIDANGEYLGETLDVEFAMGNVTSTQAKALLYEIRDAIGEDAFGKLMNSSEKYSKHFNDMMKSRLDAGLISQGTYDHLSKYFYAPTRYISDVLTDPILSMTEPTTSYGKEAILKMKKLAGGSENLNMSDYEGLLRAVTYASEYSIAENRATNRFYDLVSTNKSKFEESGIRIGTRLVPIEPSEEVKLDPIDKVIKAIQEGKKPNPLELPSGQKQLPYKGIQKAERGVQKAGEMGIQKYTAPTDVVTDENGNKFRVVQEPLREGEDYIKTYFNGQRYDIIVPAWFATQWYNRNTITNRYVTGATSWIAKLTGSNVLRVIATGINPVFGVAQLIPDTISAYASTLEERKLPILIDYPVFFVKVLAASKDIKNKSKDFQEAVQYGATTNFYNGGMVSFERGIMGKEDNSLEKVIEQWNVPGLKQYIMGSKKITETTEQMSKVALYKSIRDAKINEFKKENNREPNTQELEDIKIESGSAARATADFHRKGVLGGELNKIVPYLNAGIQVQRAVLTSAKNNPGKMLSSAFEFVSYGALLTLSALGMGDDDELKEKKRKAYLKLSDFDRDNRVLLYFVESKEKFISVKIPEFLVPLQSLQRRMVERVYLENKSLTSKDAHEISRNVADAFPLTQFVNYEKVVSRNPAAAAYSKFVNNRDPYRQEEVVPYEKATKDYLEGAEAGKKKASKISQYIGKAARNPFLPEGLSPKRLDAAASSIPFQSNPFSGAILFGLEASTSEKDLFEERYGKSTAEKVLKASGLTDRYFKEGSKINQNITGLPMENVKDRGEFKNTIAEMLIPRFDSAATKMTNPEAFKKVRSEFVKNEYQQLSPEQKQIARGFIEGELKAKAKSKTKDEMVIQIAKMEGSDAKVDGIIETLNTIKVTEDSKVKFIRDLVDAGLVSSSDFTKTLNVRGRETLNNGQKNEYYEPQVGYIRDEIKKYIQEKRAAKLK